MPQPSFIQGKNVILYFLTSESPEIFTVIGCARNVKLNMNTDTAEKTTQGSGTFREYKPLATSWTASVDGLSSIDNVTVRDLIALQKALTVIVMQFEIGDGGLPLNGDVIITSVENGGNYNDAATFNLSLQGTGELLIFYGNFPTAFQIISVHVGVPTAGQTTLDFVWNPATPTPASYTIRQTDLTSGIITYYENIPEAGHTKSIIVLNSDNYSFAIQSVYAHGVSDYSPEITYP
jgi:predicted secreted protein